MYYGYITKLKNIRKAENSDRLYICDVFGTTVVIDDTFNENNLYIYFPTDGQLSEEYCVYNDLVRRKDEKGNPCGGYLDPNKRNIKTIRLRGNVSDGLIMPISSLSYLNPDILNGFKEGDRIDVLDGHEICRKYIPRTNPKNNTSKGNKARKKKVPIAPLFAEHADTEQLAYNLNAFKPNDLIEITLKMHGTSQRTGYLPKLTGYKRTIFDRILRREGTPIYDWGYVTGTRRTVLENFDGGFYGSNEFRRLTSNAFKGKLLKGETVYYEVLGFDDNGRPIMPICNNKKINDKDFIKQYGDTTVFSYGCDPDNGFADVIYPYTQPAIPSHGILEPDEIIPKTTLYVYRMTMTNEDGDVVEYTPDYMRYRCEQMGVKCVPVFWKGYIPNEVTNGFVQIEDFITDINEEFDEWLLKTPGDYIKDIAEQFYDGPDPIGKTHIREGVVVRIINRPKFTAYKHKNTSFKILEGIIKSDAENPDIEEMEEINDNC